MSDFKFDGSIVKIQLHNFMTYSDLEVSLGPNLNMVLGPNGTGKSAIVCSIILGLAGNVSLTGRGSSPADFVKKKQKSGSTLIELYNSNGPNYTVKRTITINKHTEYKIECSNSWELNGKSCNHVQIRKFIEQLNIKVDNLCQFLPQDSVAQFVKMNSRELLVNTLKAVGDNSLVEDQEKLVESTIEIQENEKTLARLEADREANEVNKERLEGEVRILKQRAKLIAEKKVVEEKIHYVRFKKAKSDRDGCKKQLHEHRKELNRKVQQSEPFKKSIETYETQVRDLKQFRSRYEKNCEQCLDLANESKQELASVKVWCQSDFAAFKNKEEEERDRESRLARVEEEVNTLEYKLSEARDTDCTRQLKIVGEQMDSKRKEIMTRTAEQSELQRKIDNQNSFMSKMKSDYDQVKKTETLKFNLLENQFPKVNQAYRWLLQNQSKFKARIYAPIMCEINVKDHRHSKIIENAISRFDLTAFVCENDDDLKLFTRLIRDEFQGMKVNVILAGKPSNMNQSFNSSQQPVENLKQYGIVGYLSDLIEAPAPILRYLNDALNFNKIPYADSCNESQLKWLLDNFSKLYAGCDFYATAKSRYDSRTFTTNDKVREPNLLRFWLDKRRLEECEKNYNAAQLEKERFEKHLNDACQDLDESKANWQKLQDQMKSLKQKQNEKETIEARLDLKRKNLDRIKNEKIDLNVERHKLKAKIEKNIMKSITFLKDMGKHYAEYEKVLASQKDNALLVKIVDINLKIAKARYSNSVKDTSDLTNIIKEQEKLLREKDSEFEALRSKAEQNIPGFSRVGKLNQETQQAFDKIEWNTEEELENRKTELEFNISRIFQDDDSLLTEYKKQKLLMAEKQKAIASLKKELDGLRETRNTIKTRWLPALREVITVINRDYNDFMKKLSYEGQVHIAFDESNPDNFSEYGVNIMVKYRDEEQLTSLSATRQSGGERSVATMIYMLALQTKTSVPFRCVDEINQGMDKENERKVFELLVKTADSSSSQYFLVSPKLLSNLPYSPKMKIHIVFNGVQCRLNWSDIMKASLN